MKLRLPSIIKFFLAWGRQDTQTLAMGFFCGTRLALCLRLLLGDIGLVYPVMSMMVIGPSLPKLRQRRWSLMYDVY
jgi:hypothetical protein